MSARIGIAVPAAEIRLLGELEQVIGELPDVRPTESYTTSRVKKSEKLSRIPLDSHAQKAYKYVSFQNARSFQLIGATHSLSFSAGE